MTTKSKKIIFLAPPVTTRYVTYQNVNADVNLRKDVTDHYFKLVSELIDTNNKFSDFKDYKYIFQEKKGYKIIYNILKLYTKKYNINWYDLRSQNNRTLKHIHKKIHSLIKE